MASRFPNVDETNIDLNLIMAVCSDNEDEVQHLLQKGADPNFLTSSIIDGKAGALHSAVRRNDLNIVRRLLTHGADVNIEDEEGDTPVFSAVITNIHAEIKDVLFQHGADVNHANIVGRTPLISMMEDRINYGYEFSFGALDHLLASCNNLQQTNMDGQSLLHLVFTVHRDADDACVDPENHTCFKYLKFLIENGLSTNQIDPLGRSALHYCASCSCYPSIKLLLDLGTDPSVKDINGQTALHRLGFEPKCPGFEKALDMLLRHGCDINDVDIFGRTLLHYATSSDHSNEKAIQAIISRGASINAKDKMGLNPLHMCVMPTVIPSPATIAVEGDDANKSEIIDVIRLLVKNGLGVNDTDVSGFTPLHISLRQNNREVVVELLQLGADPNLTTVTGETALHRATFDFNIFGTFIDYCDKNGLCLDINAQDKFGSTALHWAIWFFETDAVEKLKGLGASMIINDETGRNAYQHARFLHRSCTYEALGMKGISQPEVMPLSMQINDGEVSFNRKLVYDITSFLVQQNIAIVSDADWPEVDNVIEISRNRFVNERNFENEFSSDDSNKCTMVCSETEKMIPSREYECSGIDTIYPDCPILRAVVLEKKTIDLLAWNLHLQYHKEYLQKFADIVVNSGTMGLYNEIPDNREIFTVVNSMMKTLATNVSKVNPLFTCNVSTSGSWNEGTKISAPCEFDYTWQLVNFGNYFAVEETSEYPLGYVRFRLTDEFEKSDLSRYVDSESYLDSRKVVRDLYFAINEALFLGEVTESKSICLRRCLPLEKGSISHLAFRWVGHLYKDFLIDIDIVPAITPTNWTPKSIRLDTKLTSQISHHLQWTVVLKTPDHRYVRNWNTYFRISSAHVEAMIIQNVPISVRKGFILLKALQDSLYMPQIYDEDRSNSYIEKFITTYVLKTCFLYELELAAVESHPSLHPPIGANPKIIAVYWAQRVLRRLSESIEKKMLCSFFIRELNLFINNSICKCQDSYIFESECIALQNLLAAAVKE